MTVPSARGSTLASVDRFELLTAASTRDQNETPPYWTSAAIGARLGISEAGAESVLRAAERDGLIFEDQDESRDVPAGFNRQVWFLTDAGREELYRLQDERRAGG